MTGPDGSAEPSGPVVRRKERVMENPTLGRIEAEYLNGVRSGNVRKKRSATETGGFAATGPAECPTSTSEPSTN